MSIAELVLLEMNGCTDDRVVAICREHGGREDRHTTRVCRWFFADGSIMTIHDDYAGVGYADCFCPGEHDERCRAEQELAAAALLMDEEICEEIRAEGIEDPNCFLAEYAARHCEKHGRNFNYI